MRRAPVLTKVLVSVVLMWGALFAYSYARLPNLYAMQKSTVELLMVNPEYGNTVSACSGVYLGNGYILTAGHCARETKHSSLLVRSFESDKVHHVTIIKKDFGIEKQAFTADLALLYTNKDINAKPATITCSNPTLGQELYGVGMPKTLQWAVTKGEIFSTTPRPGYRRGAWLQLDMPLIPGSSGGPIFDKFGRVRGITSHLLNTFSASFGSAFTGHSFAVSSSKMCEFLGKR